MEMTATTEAAAPTLPPPEELRRRGLFAYHDGFRTRLTDVVEVQLRMQQALPGGDMDRLDDLLTIITREETPGLPAEPPGDVPSPSDSTPVPVMSVPAALVELARVVTRAFDLPPLDEATARGLSVQERVDLLNDYLTEAGAAVGDDQEHPGEVPDDDTPVPAGADAEATP